MENKLNKSKERDNINSGYTYPSCESVESRLLKTESTKADNYEMCSNKSSKIHKKVKFNEHVTVINVVSYKKLLARQFNEKNNKIEFENDYKEDENISKCFNCNIF